MTAMDQILLVNNSKFVENSHLYLCVIVSCFIFLYPVIRVTSPERNDAERGRYCQHLHT